MLSPVLLPTPDEHWTPSPMSGKTWKESTYDLGKSSGNVDHWLTLCVDLGHTEKGITNIYPIYSLSELLNAIVTSILRGYYYTTH
jgi:hypothetical protein